MSAQELNKNKVPSVAFLIDADNLSSGGIDEAFEHLLEAGATVQIRRAYGGIEKLAGLKVVLRRHAIQGFVNQGKGTTDVALVVDAMDLLHRAGLPSTVAIGSSDADFAPLAVRLREAGILVICFAQKLISSDALPMAYDKVIYVDSKLTAMQPQVEVAKTPPSTEPLSSAPMPVAVSNGGAEIGPIPKTSIAEGTQLIAKAVAIKLKLTPVTTDEDLVSVRRILAALPGWLPNTIKQLNQLGGPLLIGGIKRGSKPLHELFRKYPDYFKVLPINGPAKQVRLIKKP